MFSFAKILRKFYSSRRGSVGIMAGLAFPVVSVASFFALDHLTVTKQQTTLQSAVDEAALTTVRGLRFVREGAGALTAAASLQISSGAGGSNNRGSSNSVLSSIADTVVRTVVEKNDANGELETFATRTDSDTVDVTATLLVETPFGSLTGLGGTIIQASAQAQLFGAQNICVIALGNNDEVGINIEQSAQIVSGDCGIYSNSTGVSSINARDSSLIDSPFICAAGGYTGGESNVSSTAVTDCPQVTDPLASRPLPVTPDACDHPFTFLANDDEIVTLEPGHYCGGLIIQDNANVQLNPGVYFISGGQLLVRDNATLMGENVAIVMDDEQGNIFFNDDAVVNLSAPETGPMAGIVIASRSVCGNDDCHFRTFEIKSARVSSLLGTIYVPEDRFIINTTMPISEEAAFTIILSRYLQGQRSSRLVLNTDYTATSVPVPDGFVGSESSRLIR